MNRATEAVISADFLRAIAFRHHLESVRAGPHTLRDERGWRTGSLVCQRLWIAEIKPAHELHACLAVVTTEQGQEASFHVRQDDGVLGVGPSRGLWPDPFAPGLDTQDWSHGVGRIHRDGIGYALYVDGGQARLALEFSNPHAANLIAIERTLLELTTLLAAHDATGGMTAYLQQ
jgi:hypothetical protein